MDGKLCDIQGAITVIFRFVCAMRDVEIISELFVLVELGMKKRC